MMNDSDYLRDIHAAQFIELCNSYQPMRVFGVNPKYNELLEQRIDRIVAAESSYYTRIHEKQDNRLVFIAPTARWILRKRTDAQSAAVPIKISYFNGRVVLQLSGDEVVHAGESIVQLQNVAAAAHGAVRLAAGFPTGPMARREPF